MPPALNTSDDIRDDGGRKTQKEDVICLTDTDSEDEVICLTASEPAAAERPPLRLFLKARRRFNAGTRRA